MNLSPLTGASATASIAGTGQAAATAAKASRSQPTGGNVAEKIAAISQGDPAGDRAADGQQLLDTFERQAGGGEDDETAPQQAGGVDATGPRAQASRPASPAPADFDLRA